MFCMKSVGILLLPTFLLISSTFLSGIIDEGEINLVSWETRRSVLTENESMILAAERTHRRDPLNNFKYYKGGWSISEKHYFYSVAYTAAPLFLITAIWFLGFAVTLLLICIRHCCCQLENYGYSRTAYALSLVFLIFFTLAAIVGCIVLYTGQEKFHSSSTSTLKYVVNQADNTVENLTIVSDYLSAAKGVGVDQIFLPASIHNSINKVDSMINAAATTLGKETDENSDKIQKVLDTVRVILIIVAAVMLLLAFLGFLLSILGLQSCVYLLAMTGWILATIALILCCLFLILHNVVGDTCVAMDEWVQNPTAHTALDDILPCVDKATAQQILSESKQVTFQLVEVVNTFITNISNTDPPKNLPPNLPPDTKRLYYNQSGPAVPVLCNPYNSDITDRKCAADEVSFTNASQEWSKYICQVSGNDICITTGRLTPEFYKQMIFAVNVSYALNIYGPFLFDLVDCSFVRQTFSGIVENHCPGLNRYSDWIFIGFVMVSVAVMVSLIFWLLYARERRHRLYTKKFVHLPAQESIGEESGGPVSSQS
ncbi:uncharacterized protein LOC110613992 isoform X2 [Manihot esculenta]|uniref:Uncharacterized protein n=1 Tax=Manihot esculenta TaxID=3983 RepID=A0ACB7HUL4_MANES|nr:uncharacterized protein LOC110613992 isoform X2 [Manihot esculenta]KAG8656217.1 hypothetical protein MANES_04G107200v8 [Manihot esculenta]